MKLWNTLLLKKRKPKNLSPLPYTCSDTCINHLASIRRIPESFQDSIIKVPPICCRVLSYRIPFLEPKNLSLLLFLPHPILTLHKTIARLDLNSCHSCTLCADWKTQLLNLASPSRAEPCLYQTHCHLAG